MRIVLGKRVQDVKNSALSCRGRHPIDAQPIDSLYKKTSWVAAGTTVTKTSLSAL